MIHTKIRMRPSITKWVAEAMIHTKIRMRLNTTNPVEVTIPSAILRQTNIINREVWATTPIQTQLHPNTPCVGAMDTILIKIRMPANIIVPAVKGTNLPPTQRLLSITNLGD